MFFLFRMQCTVATLCPPRVFCLFLTSRSNKPIVLVSLIASSGTNKLPPCLPSVMKSETKLRMTLIKFNCFSVLRLQMCPQMIAGAICDCKVSAGGHIGLDTESGSLISSVRPEGQTQDSNVLFFVTTLHFYHLNELIRASLSLHVQSFLISHFGVFFVTLECSSGEIRI